MKIFFRSITRDVAFLFLMMLFLPEATQAQFTWTGRAAAPNTSSWRAVTYGNNLFVAVGATGTGNRVMTSPDGITWTARTSTADNLWSSVTYGNGVFVAVSSDAAGGSQVMTSPDGIAWTARTAAAANAWRSVIYANNLFVAVSSDGTNRVMTSPNGITWTSRAAIADSWQSVTYGNNLFVAVAVPNGSSTDGVMTSPTVLLGQVVPQRQTAIGVA